MGVPKFFRYISERYPCLSEIVKEYQIPEFDNLYLDMNGIIHMCSHPDDGDPHFRISDEKIYADIFHYIEVLFRMIKPKKLFFMAVDGVAPRAKMNQQRARRFRSAKEAEKLEEKARNRGEILPTEARFDSNCITPGTVFMAKLHEQLKYFVVNKISTDKLWQSCKVILSGHETPGEGEHKIMDYIRYMRSQPGYDPNTRHCLYGLDADLIMLGLCTHEPNFSLLREEVKFGKKSTKRKSSPEEITFYLLHLTLMREYLELEFDAIRQRDVLKFGFDIEKVIDDWVLMGFLVGNDFIPHLPNLHIANGALPILYKTYMDVLPTFDGYINESGTLNLERFEKFMKSLANMDLENFEEQYADLKYFEAKTGRRPDGKPRKSCKPKEEAESVKTMNSDLAALIKSTNDLIVDSSINGTESDDDYSEDDSDSYNLRDDEMFKDEFEQHKQDYYRNKLDYADVTSDVYKSQAEGYVRAIQWNLNYYYNGVCSWSWYYPHHYAPYTSDITGFSDLKLKFDLAKPFLPYEQLLAVLPAASKQLLPEPYHHLMTEETSLIKEYYPEEFQTDLNGKRAEWEAVVLIPFIDESVLLRAMEPCNQQLSEEEKRRNTHGPMLIYCFSKENLGTYDAPEYFVPVKKNHASVISLSIDDIRVPEEKLIKGRYPGATADMYYMGFPTLKHLEFTHSLEKAGVKVHEHSSRGENMILKVKKKAIKPIEEESLLDTVARKLLGTTIYVAWPHLVEALVVSVSDEAYRYHSTKEKGHYNVEENKGNMAQTWQMEKDSITNYYMSRFGVYVGQTEILVHVKTMIGRKYIFTSQNRATLEKQWAPITSAYPLQTIVKDIAVSEGKYSLYKDVESIFPVGSACFMLGHPHYGSMGEVKDSKESLKKGRIKICMRAYEEPDTNYLRNYCEAFRVRYMDLQAACAKSALSKNLFSRITGTIFVTSNPRKKGGASDDGNKVNIGLNLKFTARNEEVPGYTQRRNGVWYYSERAVELVKDYNRFRPHLFEYIQVHSENIYFVEELFPDSDGKNELEEIIAWIKSQPFYSIEKRACGNSVLDIDVVAKVQEVIDRHNETTTAKDVMMQVRPYLLFKPELSNGNIAPDPTTTFDLYDRVVNIRESYTVPLGLRGTIIALHTENKENSEPIYDVVFDEEFTGGLALNCSPNRGYRLPKTALINKSHGKRQLEEKTGKPGQIIQRLNSNNAQQQQQNVNYFNYNNSSNNNNGYHQRYPPQNSAFAMWPNQVNQALRPAILPQNFNYPIHSAMNYGNAYQPNNFGSIPMPIPPPSAGPLPPPPAGLMPPPLAGPLPPPPAGPMPSRQNFVHEEQPQSRNYYNQVISSPQKQRPNTIPTKKAPETQRQFQNTSERSRSERPKINTDFLKKVLNIQNQNTEINHSEKPKNLSPYSSVQLLSYFQSNSLGCPYYSYYDLPDKTVQAHLVNPISGQIVCGNPAGNKLEASELAAAELLKILSQPSSNIPPTPPKSWWQSNKNENVKQKEVTQMTKKSGPLVSSPFVPLQAVRSHVSKRSNSKSENRDVSCKQNENDSTKAEAKEVIADVTSAPKVVKEVDVGQKPRRERKMRIAANFQIKIGE